MEISAISIVNNNLLNVTPYLSIKSLTGLDFIETPSLFIKESSSFAIATLSHTKDYPSV
jgi:hypothetical protein